MLNKVIIMGRIAQDLEVRQTQNGRPVVSFAVAVQRNFKDQNGEYQSDFIDCVAWGQQAEFIGRYFSKGRMICIEGNLRKRTYDDKNGTKHYVTEVYVDAVNFTGEPRQGNGGGTYQNAYGNGGYQQQSGGYQQGGSYQQGGYQQQNNSGYSQQQSGGYNNGGRGQSQQNDNESLSLGDLSDFEDVLSDDGVPF